MDKEAHHNIITTLLKLLLPLRMEILTEDQIRILVHFKFFYIVSLTDTRATFQLALSRFCKKKMMGLRYILT